jgi:hypothetical protein
MIKEAGILLRKESTFHCEATWAPGVRMMKPSRREAWVVKFFPAIHLITQEIPELGGLVDTTRPSASHAHNGDRFMLVTLRRSHGELEVTLIAKGIERSQLSALELHRNRQRERCAVTMKED